MKFLNIILDLIFPANCISCGKNGTILCSKCLLDSPNSRYEEAKWIFPLFDYRHPVIKKAIGLLKYKNKKGLAKIFAEILYFEILEVIADFSQLENFNNPILIPIPLAPKRKRERGFNQAELICKHLIKLNRDSNLRHGVDSTNWTLEKNILTKPKDTEHQARIKDRGERLKNLTGSFAIKNSEKIKNRNIILIDDVTTTGATLSEARKVLKRAGARKIIAFTVAH